MKEYIQNVLILIVGLTGLSLEQPKTLHDGVTAPLAKARGF